MANQVRRYLPTSLGGGAERKGTLPQAGAMPASTADWAQVAAADSHDRMGLVFSKLISVKMPLLVGSDFALAEASWTKKITAGFAVPELLLHFVLSGMTPLEALQTATLNPAVALRATDSLGTVEAGKVADLVLLDADPLVDIWNTTKIRAVLANGRYYDRAALDGLLAATEQAAARR
jgi:imidazolonepropionase-like amidohydrolase